MSSSSEEAFLGPDPGWLFSDSDEDAAMYEYLYNGIDWLSPELDNMDEAALRQLAIETEEARAAKFTKTMQDITEAKIAAMRERARAQLEAQRSKHAAAMERLETEMRHERVKQLFHSYTSRDKDLSPSKALSKAEAVVHKRD